MNGFLFFLWAARSVVMMFVWMCVAPAVLFISVAESAITEGRASFKLTIVMLTQFGRYLNRDDRKEAIDPS